MILKPLKTRKMKTVFATLLFSLFFVVGSAQSFSKQDTEVFNYVVTAKNARQIHSTLLAANHLKKEDEANFGNFEIIVCGKDVGELTDPKKITEIYKRANHQGVKLIACGFSLKKFNVDRKKLPKGMEIVENGILHNLQLQTKNYINLEL